MGAKLEVRDHGFFELFKRAKEIKGGYAKVGVLADDNKGSKQHDEDSPLTVAEIAAVLEYGTDDKHIPSRPALRSTFDKQLEPLAKDGKFLMGEVLMGRMPLEHALGIMGAKLSTETKKTITEGAGVPPPNAPSTIARKGSDRPWVDTATVLRAFTWAIKKKGEE